MLVHLRQRLIGGRGRPARGERLAFAKLFHLPQPEQQLEVRMGLPHGAGEHIIEAVLVGFDQLLDVVRRPFLPEIDIVLSAHLPDGGDGQIVGAEIERFGEPERQAAAEAAELILGLFHRLRQVRPPGQCELAKRHAPEPAFLGWQQPGDFLESVIPDGTADAHEVNLGRAVTRGPRHRRSSLVVEQHQVGDRVGKTEKPLLQLRPVEGEQQIQHVLGGFRVAHGQVGLQKIDAGGRAVPLGIVMGRDELDDFPRMAGHAQVTRDGDEHVGPRAGRGQHFLVNRHGAGEVLQFERFARLFEPRQHPAGRRRAL